MPAEGVLSLHIPGVAAAAEVAPAHMVDGPNGSAIVDPAKVVTTPPAAAVKPADGERPAWLPEKFKSAEDFAASYKELETKLGTTPKPATEPVVKPADAAAKGVDLKALGTEYARDGKLSEKSMADLAAKGFTADQVETYVDGLKARSTQTRAEFADLAGGDETLTNVLEWAKASLTADESQAYNSLLESGNTAAAKIAFQGIVARYTQSVGNDPNLVTGSSTPSMTGVKPFLSQAQVTEAMRDKRYATDPAYRESVAKRLSISFNS